MEHVAAARPPRLRRPPAPPGDALSMLPRRGLRPSLARPDLPFPPDISSETADALAERRGHYAFRLFVRGVIQHGDGFTLKRRAISVQPRPRRSRHAALAAILTWWRREKGS